jgi:hypothetical protein
VLRDKNLRPVYGALLAISVYYGDSRISGDVESQGSSDEMPLKGIQKQIEVEWVGRPDNPRGPLIIN